MEATFTLNFGGPAPREPLSIYHLAQAFYLAGNRCSLNIEIGPGVTQSLVSPAVVNYCFAVELFCKALIEMTGRKPKHIHELDELFHAIPSEDQEAITEAYTAIFSDPSLADLLDEVSNYFQEVRYSYEYNIFNFQDTPIAVLAHCVYIHVAAKLGQGSPMPGTNG